MCGICGFITKNKISTETLRLMNDSMTHRGPDDSGEIIYDLGKSFLGLAQRRLSVVDLSPLGHQPMSSSDGRIVLVFNGEIYNFKELKEELQDYSFLSNTDTEIIIASYLKWGKDCVKKFNGMFSIAIFDRETEELILFRDRMGKKPLYYWQEGENFVFASELKAMMLFPGFKREINRNVLSKFLYHQYIAAPDTIFKNTKKLTAGSYLVIKNNKMQQVVYWDCLNSYQKLKNSSKMNYAEAKEELDRQLIKSVGYRIQADVPVGSFLSGGYDSSLVTAIAKKHFNPSLKTYSIGFEDETFDEAKFAKAISEYLGTDHTELYFSEKSLMDSVHSIPKFYDEPFADNSALPTMAVCELAKKDVTVVLSGDGGDEFFCGYSSYDAIKKAQQFEPIGKMAYYFFNAPVLKNYNFTENIPNKFNIVINNRNPSSKSQICKEQYLDLCRNLTESKDMISYREETLFFEKNWQVRKMLLDMQYFLIDDILVKVDRASMRYSLEARCPLLDTNVIEYSFSLPHRYKYEKGIKKRLLKDLAYEYIPQNLLDRKKQGFSSPVEKWLKNILKEELLAFSTTEILNKQGLFNATVVNNLIDTFLKETIPPKDVSSYTRIIWSYYMFQLWYQEYIGFC